LKDTMTISRMELHF